MGKKGDTDFCGKICEKQGCYKTWRSKCLQNQLNK